MNAQAAGMSHFILDFTDNCLEAANQSVCIRDIEASGEYDLEWGTYSSANPSNPGMGGTIVGLKFDDTDFDSPGTISFTSSRAPVWGDFYIKGGSSSFIYNAGLANHASENILDFIARPNGTGTPTQQNDVPEPATLGIVGAGLAALAVMRRRRA
jgi:hypothetical protein